MSEIVLVGPTGLDLVELDDGTQHSELGGCCRNTAVALSRMGVSATFVTQAFPRDAVPVDEGAEPSLDEIRISMGGREWIGVFKATIKNNEMVATAEYDDAPLFFNSDFARLVTERVSLQRVFVGCSDISRSCWETLAEALRSQGLTTALVTSGVPVPADYAQWWPLASWLFINDVEVAEMGVSPSDAVELALSVGVERIFITRGSKGVLYASQDVVQEFGASPISRFTSPIGAGDAFTAAVLFAMRRNIPITRAIEFAQTCAREVIASRSNKLPQTAADAAQHL